MSWACYMYSLLMKKGLIILIIKTKLELHFFYEKYLLTHLCTLAISDDLYKIALKMKMYPHAKIMQLLFHQDFSGKLYKTHNMHGATGHSLQF